MAAILKTVKSSYLGNVSTDVHKIGMVTKIDPRNPMDRMRCCLQNRLVHPKNHILVAGAHWHIMVNTTEPFMCSSQQWNQSKCHFEGTLLWAQQNHY